MWGYVFWGGLAAATIGYDYLSSPDEPPDITEPDNTAGLLKISLILGIIVSGVTLYQFWRKS